MNFFFLKKKKKKTLSDSAIVPLFGQSSLSSARV